MLQKFGKNTKPKIEEKKQAEIKTGSFNGAGGTGMIEPMTRSRNVRFFAAYLASGDP